MRTPDCFHKPNMVRRCFHQIPHKVSNYQRTHHHSAITLTDCRRLIGLIPQSGSPWARSILTANLSSLPFQYRNRSLPARCLLSALTHQPHQKCHGLSTIIVSMSSFTSLKVSALLQPPHIGTPVTTQPSAYLSHYAPPPIALETIAASARTLETLRKP